MGSLNTVFDAPAEDKESVLGTYGQGLQAAFGSNLGLLDELPIATTFDKVKFSVGGGFQFDFNLLTEDTPVLCDYLDLAAAIKIHYKLDPAQAADPKRVVVVTRKESESRRLSNAPELAQDLIAAGWNTSLLTMGSLSFAEQLRHSVDAKVMIGVHGSDMVSFLFMPFQAAVIEIMPLVSGIPMFNPELHNQARNQGKVHYYYYSPENATLFLDPDTGKPIDARPVHQAKLVKVHSDVLSLVHGAVQASNASLFYGLSVSYTNRQMSCLYDRPVPRGLLHGCAGHDC